MGAGVAVRAVILRYLDQVARVRSIRAAEVCPPSAVWMSPTKRCGDGYRSSGRMFLARTSQARNRSRRSKKSIQRRERMIEDMRKAGVREG
jgi:hypothetical protein